MSDEEDEEKTVTITINYEGIRRDIEFDFDYNNLNSRTLNCFKIDSKKYKLLFYYKDDEDKKVEINNKNYDYSSLQEIYKKSNNKLMLYVEKEIKEKKDEKIKIKKKEEEEKIKIIKQVPHDDNDNDEQNINNDNNDEFNEFNFYPGGNDQQNFYEEFNDLANNLKPDSKTEENKEINNPLKPKFSGDMGDINFTSINFGNKKISKYKLKDLEEAQSKHDIIIQKKQDSEIKNKKLKQNIIEMKEKIEKSKIELNNKNKIDEEEEKQLLIKLSNEEKNLKKIQEEKQKQLAELKERNANLKNLIASLSSGINQQKGGKSQIPELNNDISFKIDISHISKSDISFFTLIEEANNYLPKKEKNNKKKEAKIKKLKKINEINKQKKKEIKEKSIEELNACKKLEDSFHSSFIEKNQKQKSYILIKKEQNEKNNDNNENNEINKENKQLKDDIKELEEKIKEAQKEIENMKKLFDKEIKYLQGKK